MADSSSPTRKYVRLEEMPDEEPHARAPAAPKFLREHTAKDLEREAKANVRRETAILKPRRFGTHACSAWYTCKFSCNPRKS